MSTHSMRKTCGFAMHKAGASFETIAETLNHSYWLVVGQIVPFNPAGCVRGLKLVMKVDKAPALTADEARSLVDTDMLIGLRNRAL